MYTGMAENEFIKRVTKCIEDHLGETYSVEQLAADLNMERTGLYKRLTQIIDCSPQMFIRSVRLHRACHLLRNTSDSITDIARIVGFSTPSYFVRCFKDEYGCTPKEWREKQL